MSDPRRARYSAAISILRRVRKLDITPEHFAAIDHVRQLAQRHRRSARSELEAIIARAGLRASAVVEILDAVWMHARVAIHFHPDRLFADGKTVARGLLEAGVYKNQYETGISGGSPTAFVGGDRHGWEEELFGGAYSRVESGLPSRPKYGALQIWRHPDGASPRFGSSYFILSAAATRRCTFTFQGSQEDVALTQSGSFDIMEPVVAALFRTMEQEGEILGRRFSTVADFVEQLMLRLSAPQVDPSRDELGRALDSFVEAQVHGSVRLADDVEHLIVDPIYRGTETGEILREISRMYGITLAWHPGYTLPVRDVPPHFRGYATTSLAKRIAGDGEIDAAKIGLAANSHRVDPDAWSELGSRDDALTHFRRIWHVLVKKALPLCSRHESGS